MREPTISAVSVRALLELSVKLGAERQALLDASRIAHDDLLDGDNRIPFARYAALMRAGQRQANDPALGLHYGEAFDVAELSIGCVVSGMSATSMDGIIGQLNRFARIGADVECEGDGDRLRLCRTASTLWLIDARKNPNAFPEHTEASFARIITSTRNVVGRLPLFTAVEFTHWEPQYRTEYDRIFQVPVTFGSSRNAIGINEALLHTIPRPASSPLVEKVVREHAEALLTHVNGVRSIRGQVEMLLRPLLESGSGTVEAVARSMALSRQTLFRRLKAEGVTFEQVRDAARHRLAVSYMTDGGASVSHTAAMLGYKSPASFSRAFKRWTGASPRVVQQRKRNAP
ncbi:MAG: AraC family transcriptional regulator ligand-binding domain-containing protein, partial [bacterium]